jgi:cytochrome c nitrite reductase small subunit
VSRARPPARRPPSGALLAAAVGVAAGLGAYTVTYARGMAYLSDDPLACLNCHIMRDAFDGWAHSSHKAVAACNDCHTPHDPIRKWLVKAENGWNHSVAFTTGGFPEPIRIGARNARVLQESCLHCHRGLVSEIAPRNAPAEPEVACLTCHRRVGHGP